MWHAYVSETGYECTCECVRIYTHVFMCIIVYVCECMWVFEYTVSIPICGYVSGGMCECVCECGRVSVCGRVNGRVFVVMC